MDKIAVNAFIHGGALSDPIELNSHLPRQLQSTMLPASPHSASLHMKIYPACNGSVIIVDYTSTSQIGLAGKIRNNVVAGIGTDFFVVFWLRRCMCKSLA